MSHAFNKALPKRDVNVLDDLLKTIYEAYLDKDKQRLKWETEIFNLVKDFYTKIGDERIAQYTSKSRNFR